MVADHKNEEIELKTLPSPEDYEFFVAKMQSNDMVAHLTKLPDQTIIWDGPLEGIGFIGYPFITSQAEMIFDPESDDGKPDKVITPRLPDLGLPLKVLYFSNEHHCFVVVRSDVYVN